MSRPNRKTNNEGGTSSIFARKKFDRRDSSSRRSRYQQQMGLSGPGAKSGSSSEENRLKAERKKRRMKENEELDARFGYSRLTDMSDDPSARRRGYIFNMIQVTTPDEKSGVDLYLITESNDTFKCTVTYLPYFYVVASTSANLQLVTDALMRSYENSGLYQVTVVNKIDLDEVNHLVKDDGRPVLKLSFENVSHLVEVRNSIRGIIQKNKSRQKESQAFSNLLQQHLTNNSSNANYHSSPLECLVEMREYDVPFTIRIAIDLNIRCGSWYTVTETKQSTSLKHHPEITKKPNLTILAFDIECTKAPLKFPESSVDQIFMISYMVTGLGGFLIINREVVSSDIADFEYTPQPKYPGPFHIFNEQNEEDLLRRFFSHYQEIKPQIVVTYNGDFFDWPFVRDRAKLHGLYLESEIGVSERQEEYRGRCCVHLDAFHWVRRDSYLPQGSQSLKAVTKAKLGYDPVEVDPEDMVRFAQEHPVKMATYSVSDAVATYYLYEKYVHMFIFSLCTIIPMNPEDVLRKGSGTLCETLLEVQATEKNILYPNKHQDPDLKFTTQGNLLESETYIGGKVECLETGVYRSDFEYDFEMIPSAFDSLIKNVERDLTFAVEVESGKNVQDVTNMDEIKSEIIGKLEALRDRPIRSEKPFIYHLDVGAMYPNIILTNRLQPYAIVQDDFCASCDYNLDGNNCKRRMNWVWRGDYNPATKFEIQSVKSQLKRERTADGRLFNELDDSEQASLIKERLKLYSRTAYKKTKITEEVEKIDTVCMRENDFYVDTVRQFRDRRYEYKALTKNAKKDLAKAKGDAVKTKEAEDDMIVYDSLQIAHKCILNSFYGYVMRKGARWRSMEMAGIVTKTGADLIVQARELVEQIGRPLELDTDGIWCILPQSFPDVFHLTLKSGDKIRIDYPCVMLNADVNENFTNHQYQNLMEDGSYKTHSECSIFFEVDGPYRAMILPSSTEEGRLLKKRYAVFNDDGSMAELKGFELKRRGELDLIKTFQSQIFERFLDGGSLEECYQSVAKVANYWMDILDSKGECLETEELVGLLSENRNMSRQLEDYGDQKGTSLTTARRLGEFLGKEIIKDKGLNCKFVIAELPPGKPVTERAIPTAIWKTEDPAVMKHYLKKWLKSPSLENYDIRSIIDWEYYKDRFGKTIQKIITIPAALQKVQNPVPRVKHPDWLESKVRMLNDPKKQQTLGRFFSVKKKPTNKNITASGESESNPSEVVDMEDMTGMDGTANGNKKKGGIPVVHSRRKALASAASANKNKKDRSTSEKASEEVEEQQLQVRVPLSKDNFHAWLSRKKKLWKKSRENNRKRMRSTIGTNVTNAGSSKKQKKRRNAIESMEGYIQDANYSLYNEEWQIVEIREKGDFDDFLVWILLGNQLQKVTLQVPRTLYLNSLQPLNGINKVDKGLPHNKPSRLLYEVQLDEVQFKKEEWWTSFVSMEKEEDICHQRTIEAVYEQSTPLLYRAVLKLGSISKVVDKTSGALGTSFSLNQVSSVENPRQGIYLNDDLSYKRIFLFQSSLDKIGIVALFTLLGDSSDPSKAGVMGYELKANCSIWVIKPGGSKGQKNASVKTCDQLFTQIVDHLTSGEQEGEDGEEEYDFRYLSKNSKCVFTDLKYVSSEEKAYSGLNEELSSYLQAKNGPTFLLMNSTKPLPILRKSVPSISDFPNIALPFPPGVNISNLPALNWEPTATQYCMEAFLHVSMVSFPKSVLYSRFGNIPIGNLGGDVCESLYDVLFGRSLQKNRQLLWASNERMPDLGGSLMDRGNQTVSSIAENDLWNDDSQWQQQQQGLHISKAGAYRNFCVQVDISNLDIAAITDSSFLSSHAANVFSSQKDLSMVPQAGFGTTNTLGDEMACATPFQILQSLVLSWLNTVHKKATAKGSKSSSSRLSSSSIVANDLLQHLYRVVNSRTTLLHDSALFRLLQNIMKTTFLTLVNEFQRLGGKIIAANFHRILISTNKTDMASTKEYIEFVIQTIQKSDTSGTFQKLGLTASHYWSHFLYMDEHNFGGIHFESRPIETDEDNEFAITLQQKGNDKNNHSTTNTIVPTVVSGWNIMQFLSSEIEQEYFRAIIGRFSKDIFRKQMLLEKGECEDQENDSSVGNINDSSFSSSIFAKKDKTNSLLEYKKKLISKHFSSYLTRVVGEIVNEGHSGTDSFPLLPGSHIQLENPALEFIKNVVKILQLDPDVEQEVHVLHKSLLAQIGIQEYSECAKWQNPCASFILPDVFCRQCYVCRDLDLCIIDPRDASEYEGVEEIKQQHHHWLCEECGAPHDLDEIEWRLVDIIQQKSIQYQLQDLRCSKTGAVQTRTLGRQSKCSAKLNLDLVKQDLISQFGILINIAEYHNMGYLIEVANSFLDSFHNLE